MSSTSLLGHLGEESLNELLLGDVGEVGLLGRLGLDRLKEALTAVGLKCGGNLEERVDRLWAVRQALAKSTKLDRKLFAKGKEAGERRGEHLAGICDT